MYRVALGCILALMLAGCEWIQPKTDAWPGQDIEQVDFSQVECAAREDDPEGYLKAICEYALANEINTSPADPSAYFIVEITEGEKDGQRVYYILLNCCGMGDRAVIDAETGEVLGLSLGDY